MRSFILVLVFAVTAFGQSGGEYQIEKSVIASGGERSFGGSYLLESTIGQPVTGRAAGTGKFAFYGFWTPSISPTSATVRISGRVMTAGGAGIAHSLVRLIDGGGPAYSVYTNQFGNYAFSEVRAGETYIITVSAKQTTFKEPQRILTVNNSMSNIDFHSIHQ